MRVSIVLVVFVFITKDIPFMVRIANYYAFFVAGVFTMGYIFYTGIKSPAVRAESFSTGGSLGLCCIIAHAAAAIPLFPLVGFSLFGLVTLKIPMIFALSAPLALLYVLILDKVIKPSKV